MTLPPQSAVLPNIVRALQRHGGEAEPKDLYLEIAAEFPQIEPFDLQGKTPSGHNRWQNRVQWARQTLVESGVLDKSTNGVWRLTERGRHLAAMPELPLHELERSLPKATTVWVFQSNPDRYDVVQDALTTREADWATNQHRSQIHSGDRIYFYESGDRAGIYAIGVSGGNSFRTSGNQFGEWKVRIRFEGLVDPPLLKAELLADPVLADVGVFQGRQGTNFPIPAAAADRLEELVGPRLTVPDLVSSARESETEAPDSLRGTLEGILALQGEWTALNSPAMQERGRLVRNEGPRYLRVVQNDFKTGLQVEGHDGSGSKARVPWIRVYDPQHSPSATQGWYLVYLFAFDASAVFLSLNQGTTIPNHGKARPRSTDEIERSAAEARDRLGPATGPARYTSAVDLADPGELGNGYEAGNVVAIRYERGYLPNDAQLAADLVQMTSMLRRVDTTEPGVDLELSATEGAVPEQYVEPPLDAIEAALRLAGMRLESRTIRRYHLALRSRGFVVLSGISGTGKSWLASQYAAAVGARSHIEAVAPNWTTNEDLLGYFNPIDNVYRDTPFSLFLREASEAFSAAIAAGLTPRPYHVILDEMNLARVEYYFAKFLSAMETRARDGVALIELGPDESIALTPNLKFVGTVNVDETTHGFADKVYDRSQLIDLPITAELLRAELAGSTVAASLVDVWSAVKDIAPFAFRVAKEIRSYVDDAAEFGVATDEALDEQLLQKILPKVRGADLRVDEALQNLVVLSQDRWPLTRTKAQQMLDDYRNHGIASYF